jgi:hypothetical protein
MLLRHPSRQKWIPNSSDTLVNPDSYRVTERSKESGKSLLILPETDRSMQLNSSKQSFTPGESIRPAPYKPTLVYMTGATCGPNAYVFLQERQVEITALVSLLIPQSTALLTRINLDLPSTGVGDGEAAVGRGDDLEVGSAGGACGGVGDQAA